MTFDSHDPMSAIIQFPNALNTDICREKLCTAPGFEDCQAISGKATLVSVGYAVSGAIYLVLLALVRSDLRYQLSVRASVGSKLLSEQRRHVLKVRRACCGCACTSSLFLVPLQNNGLIGGLSKQS